MTRRARRDEGDSWHHVMNRGVARRALFESRADQRHFLSLLARQVRSGRLEVHAYCLLTTHYHLLVRSVDGQLGQAMQRIQNDYSRRFNRQHRRDGPLVRGRFKSKRVESGRYFNVLVRYIDANPVQAGVADRVGAFEFSSARAYLGGRMPPWLSRWRVEQVLAASGAGGYLDVFGPAHSASIEDVEWIVSARLRARDGQDPLDDLVAAAPSRVRAWLERKLAVADGPGAHVPVASPGALLAGIDEHLGREGTWKVVLQGVESPGPVLVRVGLMRHICCLTLREIASRENLSLASVRRLIARHAIAFAQDATHAQRTTSLTQTILTRTQRAWHRTTGRGRRSGGG